MAAQVCTRHTDLYTFFYGLMLLYTREQQESENGRSSSIKGDLELQYELFTSIEVCKFKLQLLSIDPMSKGKVF